ncbi:MAG: hypothetical protein R3228_11225 [Halioglobus sp.]|nr:hypothetical protein [Halioglobus sp.]
MRDSVAIDRYLQRHIETQLPQVGAGTGHYRHVLVIPAYRESPALLRRLAQVPATTGGVLVILVLNHPDSDPDGLCNEPLRAALTELEWHTSRPGMARLRGDADLFVLDLDRDIGPLPADQGVGLARKYGCDLALAWMLQGVITSPWIGCSDADAQLPRDYFERLDGVADNAPAAVFPFLHVAGDDAQCNRATALYELRLHHYVLGLEYAHSPYACHTLGSCLAVRASAYAHVRGFPRRAAAEDFYLLNKLAKLGPLARLHGRCIELACRPSHRVPFGTGPAIRSPLYDTPGADTACFYHPAGFAALRALLRCVPRLHAADAADLQHLLCEQGLDRRLAEHSRQALDTLGWSSALQHGRRQAKSAGEYTRYFNEWLDAFRTLRFLHELRERGLAPLSLRQLQGVEPQLWPRPGADVEALRRAVRSHWDWRA